MELKAALAAGGIYEPEEITVLRGVFDKAKLPEDTDIDREVRAATLIRLFDSGLRSEAELLEALGYG